MLNSKLKQTLQIKLGTRTPSWQKIFDWIDGQRKKASELEQFGLVLAQRKTNRL